MKKYVLAVVLTAILFNFSLPCFAASISERGGSESENVYAKCVYKMDGVYMEPVDGGHAQITTDDGITVKVHGELSDEWILIVMPVPKSDLEAWNWFENSLKELGTNILPFDIYFIDRAGNRVEPGTAFSVTITLPEAYGNPIAVNLKTTGEATVVESAIKGQSITLTAFQNGYYVILKKKETGIPNTPGESPGTGDTAPLGWWYFVGAGGLLLALLPKRKRTESLTKRVET